MTSVRHRGKQVWLIRDSEESTLLLQSVGGSLLMVYRFVRELRAR